MSSQDLKLGDFGANPQGTLDGDVVGGQERDDRPPACQCDDLGGDVECWPCVHRRLRA